MTESTLSISASDRRELIERLCVALNDVVADGGDAGGVLLPWQATAAYFADLPKEIVSSIVAAVDDEGAFPGGVDLGGYMQTDQGPRAWGTVALRESEQEAGAWIDVDSIDVSEGDAGWRLEATVRSSAVTREPSDV